MSHLVFLPPLAYLAAIAAIFATVQLRGPRPGLWRLPALIGALFLVYSLVTVFRDGVMMFWVNHTVNMTGNQVWFDLLFAVAISFFLMAPRARAVGMPLWPWAVATLLLACVALLPMLARVLYLEERAAARAPDAVPGAA